MFWDDESVDTELNLGHGPRGQKYAFPKVSILRVY